MSIQHYNVHCIKQSQRVTCFIWTWPNGLLTKMYHIKLNSDNNHVFHSHTQLLPSSALKTYLACSSLKIQTRYFNISVPDERKLPYDILHRLPAANFIQGSYPSFYEVLLPHLIWFIFHITLEQGGKKEVFLLLTIVL